ncbi:hypothetical protein Dimus_024201 [Dionaea muscipula]
MISWKGKGVGLVRLRVLGKRGKMDEAEARRGLEAVVQKKRKNGGGMSMQCLYCKKYLYYNSKGAYDATGGAYRNGPCWTTSEGYWTTNGPGTCKECYVEARDTAVELKRLKRENKELKANVDFLRLSSPPAHDDPIPRSSPLSSDVTLVISDICPFALVRANRFILASRSPVFKAMLETKMKESISGMIKISDVTYDSLRAFVNYLYTAEVFLDEQIACDLLVLAEKYQVKHLKEHCESYLVSSLNWDNSVSNYLFANQHGARKLLEASLSIITDNMDKFMNTDEYRELVENDASFVVRIFEAHMAKQVNTAAKNASLG